VASDRIRLLETVAARLGPVFRDLSLLDRALTHASLGNERRSAAASATKTSSRSVSRRISSKR
jgi:dsRNA-specific ribonuclease